MDLICRKCGNTEEFFGIRCTSDIISGDGQYLGTEDEPGVGPYEYEQYICKKCGSTDVHDRS
jgi:hypothetical protein